MNTAVRFERALFFSWYCGLGDCTFCYMSTQPNTVDPKKARRSAASIFAEAIIARECGWDIEFISGGYHSYSFEELLFLVKGVHNITGKKQWLNIGYLSKHQLEQFLPDIIGYAGTVESVNWDVRKKVCPSKHLGPILRTFEACDALGLDKAITIIVGLGESIADVANLVAFVKEHRISRITFYSLNPHPKTPFSSPPDKEYYAQWISKTKQSLPSVEIVAGAWLDKPEYFTAVLEAGADNITKLPAVRKFGSKQAYEIESAIGAANRSFTGSLTKLPLVDWIGCVDALDEQLFSLELKKNIKEKLNSYLIAMAKN